MRIILVEWDDTHVDSDWTAIESRSLVANCWTIGVPIYEDDRQIEIIATRCIAGMKLQMITIPKGCIKRMRRLRI